MGTNGRPPISKEDKIALANFLGSTMKNTKQLDGSVVEHASGSKPPEHTEHVIQKAAGQVERLAGCQNPGGRPGAVDGMPPLAALPHDMVPIPDMIPMPEFEPPSEEYLAAKAAAEGHTGTTPLEGLPTTGTPPEQTVTAPPVYTAPILSNPAPSDDGQMDFDLKIPKGDLKMIMDAIHRVEDKLDRLERLTNKLGNVIK